MAFDNVTVFMYEDGTVCDPFDDDAYLCASFSPGGLIIDYRFIGSLTSPEMQRSMYEFGLDCVTVSEPLNNIEDVRRALDHVIEYE